MDVLLACFPISLMVIRSVSPAWLLSPGMVGSMRFLAVMAGLACCLGEVSGVVVTGTTTVSSLVSLTTVFLNSSVLPSGFAGRMGLTWRWGEWVGGGLAGEEVVGKGWGGDFTREVEVGWAGEEEEEETGRVGGG